METSGSNSDQYANSSSASSIGGVNNNTDSNSSTVTWYGMPVSSVSPFRSPLSFLLDYSGILRSNSHDSEGVPANGGVANSELRPQLQIQSLDPSADTACSGSSSTGEVAIRIIGAGEQDHNVGLGSVSSQSPNQIGEMGLDDNDELMGSRGGIPALENDAEGRSGIAMGERLPLVSSSSSSGSEQVNDDAANGSESSSRDSPSYQRYDIQQVAKWIEQILPFSLLLLVVFIRQHLQGTILSLYYVTCVS